MKLIKFLMVALITVCTFAANAQVAIRARIGAHPHHSYYHHYHHRVWRHHHRW